MKKNTVIKFILGFVILFLIGLIIFFAINLFSGSETLSSTMKSNYEIIFEDKNNTDLGNQRMVFAMNTENKNEIVCKCIGISCFLLAFLILFLLFLDLSNESIKFSKIDLLSKNYEKNTRKNKSSNSIKHLHKH